MSTVPDLDSSVIEVWEVDLADFSSVKAFAMRVRKELTRLDVLLLNAGIIPASWVSTKDGWESAYAPRNIFLWLQTNDA